VACNSFFTVSRTYWSYGSEPAVWSWAWYGLGNVRLAAFWAEMSPIVTMPFST